MLGLAAAVAPITLFVSPPVAMAIAVVTWIGGSAWAINRFENDIDGWSIICAIVPLIMVTFGFHDYLSLERGATVADIPVAQAPQYSSGSRFNFTDSVVQRKMAATFRSSSRDRKTGRLRYHYYNVAPLTSKDWTAAEPVPAWVGCSDGFNEKCSEWRNACTSAIPVEDLDRQGLRKAIELSMSQNSLRVATSAPLLQCVPSIEAGRQERARRLWLPMVVIYLFWAVCTLIYQGVQAVRDR